MQLMRTDIVVYHLPWRSSRVGTRCTSSSSEMLPHQVNMLFTPSLKGAIASKGAWDWTVEGIGTSVNWGRV